MEHRVLVGTVKNERQLEVNLNEKFYHIPKAVVPEKMLPVGYVALYLPAGVFGEDGEKSCIKYYGKIAETRVVRRSEITSLPSQNGDVNYYKFEIEEWLPLPNQIERDVGGIYAKAFTSLEDLLSAKKISEITNGRKTERRKLYKHGFSDEEISKICTTDDPVGVKMIASRANEAAGREKVTAVQISKYLLQNGFLEIEHDEKTDTDVRVPTEKGSALGIENFWEINKYYEEYSKNYYSKAAQQFIVEHLNEIVMIKASEAFKNG